MKMICGGLWTIITIVTCVAMSACKQRSYEDRGVATYRVPAAMDSAICMAHAPPLEYYRSDRAYCIIHSTFPVLRLEICPIDFVPPRVRNYMMHSGRVLALSCGRTLPLLMEFEIGSANSFFNTLDSSRSEYLGQNGIEFSYAGNKMISIILNQ